MRVRRLLATSSVIDQYLIKYGSSVVGYAIMSLPVFFPQAGATTQSVGANTRGVFDNVDASIYPYVFCVSVLRFVGKLF